MNSKVRYLGLLLIFSIACFSVFGQNKIDGEPEVRVRILKTDEIVKISLNGKWTLIIDSSNETILKDKSIWEVKFEDDLILLNEVAKKNHIEGESLKLSSIDGKGTIDIFDVPYGVGWWWEGKEDRTYEGEISFYKSEDNYLEVMVKLPLESYLKGVVPYEIGGDSPLEALKAQAIAARSEAFVALSSGMYGGKHHDLTSDVECQVFSGNRKRTELSDQAVDETRGIVLTEKGEIINAYYASNCGGHSELIKNVWPDRPEKESYKIAKRDWKNGETKDLSKEENIREWILSKPESFCNPYMKHEVPDWSKKYYRWELYFSTDEISQMIAGNKYGKLINIEPLKRGGSCRIIKAKFLFEQYEIVVEGELNICQLFKPSLKSSCFIVEKDETGFLLKGAGWGHGVGMCQSGAVAQALSGINFEEILNHYYQKAEIMKLY